MADLEKSFRIDNIKGALELGGARPTLFNVLIKEPIQGVAGLNFFQLEFLCKASNLPVSTVAPIEVPYFGRKIKVAGNRTYPEWTVTIINDENFTLRKTFQEWLEAINAPRNNIRDGGATSAPASYKGSAEVRQYGKDGSIIQIYQFEGLFPSEVSAIDVDWGKDNEIEEFTVTLQYDFWTKKDQ